MRVFEQEFPEKSTGAFALRQDRGTEASRRLPSWLGSLFVVAGLLIAAAAGWTLWNEKQALGERLEQADRHVGLTEQQINQLLADMGRERIELMQAHEQVARANEDSATTAAARAQIEQERSAASEQTQAARLQMQEARAAAGEAEQEKKQIRAERLAELTHLQQAMGKIVKTTPAAWGVSAGVGRATDLFHDGSDVFEESGREILSRVAGVFLGSNGYQIALTVRDPAKSKSESDLLRKRMQAVAKYLVDAGVPSEILSLSVTAEPSKRGSDSEWLELSIVDTILPENRNVAESIVAKGVRPAASGPKKSKGRS